MLKYVAKILKITLLEESEYEEITSPYRESKSLSPSTYDPLIEVEIISVEYYNELIKTSCFTTIGFRSSDEVEKYRELTHVKTNSQELESVITLSRLRDLKAGELIKFPYPEPESRGEDCNLIRYQNKLLTIEDFKSKSYPSRIDNTLEDSPKRFPHSFIGLSKFEKVRAHWLKEVWFGLQGRYRFLIEIKQKLLYTKRSAWEKAKLTISIVVSAIFIIYALYPTLLSEPKHRWAFVITTLINVLKELF